MSTRLQIVQVPENEVYGEDTCFYCDLPFELDHRNKNSCLELGGYMYIHNSCAKDLAEDLLRNLK